MKKPARISDSLLKRLIEYENEFAIPIAPVDGAEYFPAFLNERLVRYQDFVSQKLAPALQGRSLLTATHSYPLAQVIDLMIQTIEKAVACYYRGEVL